MTSEAADAHPSATPVNDACDPVDDGSQPASEAASTATSPAPGMVLPAPGKKKSGRRPRRKKKPHAPGSQAEHGQGMPKHQNRPGRTSSSAQGLHQQQQQRQEKRQNSPSRKDQHTNASAAHAQSKAAPKPGPPRAASEINKSLSVAMMASPLFPLPFPLMPVLGATLLAGQGKPCSERKKGDGTDVKPGNG
ncbi:uncharacterized protein PpBr36_10180 [Pyricularia pennisetigena]|uniref:uncharacterized protein n=1 Tax=Pyricularia pennisetigena TaxID=1578925 RepID=UPI0011548B5F|nr:uncharacterized protein PpBr36_10180 [Pyricularia pennisetigena]TLS21490.1 hypothetical protein PpBr36_10180 [Pyricularia pennisetigena]